MSTTFPLRVKGARVIIKLDPPEVKTMGGIIIPGAEDQESNRGTIMAAGEGQRLNNGVVFPMSVAVGDRVIFNPNQGAPVSVLGDGENYIAINEVHILAIMD